MVPACRQLDCSYLYGSVHVRAAICSVPRVTKRHRSFSSYLFVGPARCIFGNAYEISERKIKSGRRLPPCESHMACERGVGGGALLKTGQLERDTSSVPCAMNCFYFKRPKSEKEQHSHCPQSQKLYGPGSRMERKGQGACDIDHQPFKEQEALGPWGQKAWTGSRP